MSGSCVGCGGAPVFRAQPSTAVDASSSHPDKQTGFLGRIAPSTAIIGYKTKFIRTDRGGVQIKLRKLYRISF
jgi:hypothetical protein